jgi:hypothetical protein
MPIEFPITVNGIEWDEEADPITPDRIFGGKAGSWVAVRPVGHEKTYLGVLLGDYHPPAVTFYPETGTLKVVKSMGNPAMWVPDLNRVIMGWGSWWGTIDKPEDLHQITDADIQNVWYVQALKALSEKEPKAD